MKKAMARIREEVVKSQIEVRKEARKPGITTRGETKGSRVSEIYSMGGNQICGPTQVRSPSVFNDKEMDSSTQFSLGDVERSDGHRSSPWSELDWPPFRMAPLTLKPLIQVTWISHYCPVLTNPVT